MELQEQVGQTEMGRRVPEYLLLETRASPSAVTTSGAPCDEWHERSKGSCEGMPVSHPHITKGKAHPSLQSIDTVVHLRGTFFVAHFSEIYGCGTS